MDFGKLKEVFKQKANEISKTKDKTARFRAASYNRVVSVIESKYSDDEKATSEKIDQLVISDYMKSKAKEYLVSKPKKEKKEEKKYDKDQLRRELSYFMGIGESRAQQLIEEGLTHINQLHTKKWMEKLPVETQTFLKLKPKSPIPREDILSLQPYILKLKKPGVKLEIVGSFRREKKTSNDIDVMVTSNDTDIINKLLVRLQKMLSNKAYPYSKGKDKMSIIIDMKDILGKSDSVYKVDFFRVNEEDAAAMLLYSTGSKEHNILMRKLAKQKGMLLNQNGLYKKTNDKLVKLDLSSEEEFFEALGLNYKEPKDRI